MEIKIFLTYKDFINLSDFLLTSFKAAFSPENTFDKPTGNLLTTVHEIERHIEKYSDTELKGDTFLITSPYWSVEPIYYGYIPNNKNIPPFYYGHARYGGPSFHYIPTFNKLRAEIISEIIAGSLSDYSYYISGSFLKDKENGFKTISRPESMKKAGEGIRKYIRQNGQMVAHRNGKHAQIGYAMNDAISYYKNGVRLFQGNLEFKPEIKNYR